MSPADASHDHTASDSSSPAPADADARLRQLMPLGVGGDLDVPEQQEYEALLALASPALAREAAAYRERRDRLIALGDAPAPALPEVFRQRLRERTLAEFAERRAVRTSHSARVVRLAFGIVRHPAAAAVLVLGLAASLLLLPEPQAGVPAPSAGASASAPATVPVAEPDPTAPAPVISPDPRRVWLGNRFWNDLNPPPQLRPAHYAESTPDGLTNIRPNITSALPKRVVTGLGGSFAKPKRGSVHSSGEGLTVDF